ncbi:PEP-CTERM sorting domain-containing protein [Thalassotalea mangrovi]|nr:PEP-CTERM sorting domain-containing protein [Thalassotalea mangrovi]
MSLKQLIPGIILSFSFLICSQASAALMVIGGTDVLLADVEKYGQGGASAGTPPELLTIYSGANIKQTMATDYEYSITFLYKQATFHNVFTAPDGQTVDTDSQSMITGSFSVGAGEYLNLVFGAKCDAMFAGCTEIANGMNIDAESSSAANFAVSELMVEGDVTRFYLFLNDTGSSPDNDFDDLIVLVELTDVTIPPSEVPEPSSILLFALATLGLLRLRK